MSDPQPPILWTWRLILVRLRRILWPALAALALWLAWTLVALALREEEQGPFIALLLLGLCTFVSVVMAGLAWYRFTRRLRARDAAEQAQLIWLNQALQLRRPLPPLGTWTASPDLLVALWRIIREERPARVLEIGSGLSTIVMARALEQNQDGGELVSLEDHLQFAGKTRRELEEIGLGANTRVMDAPLKKQHVAGQHGYWYTLPAVHGLEDLDLVLVDGPAVKDRELALFVLHELLAATALIVVDDTDRPESRQMLKLWQDAFAGQLRQTEVGGAKWALLRWQRSAGRSDAGQAGVSLTSH